MTTINSLTDASLAQIFQRLPSIDRLRVSEVCRRWYSISQDPWRVVTRLDLDSSIPAESIGAIVRMCPNLTSLSCKDQQLILDDLRSITLASLKSVAYHNCSFVSHDNTANKAALPLFRSEHGQSMEELVLHDHNFGVESTLSDRHSQRLLPNWLKRLQLSGRIKVNDLSISTAQKRYFTELTKLRSLECLLIDSNSGCFSTFDSTIKALRSLSGLRELSLPSSFTNRFNAGTIIAESAMNLPKLEILVLPAEFPSCDWWDGLAAMPELFLEHPTLRIIIIPGDPESYLAEMQVPIRKRFPLGFAADALPLLHVFVGKSAAELFRFDDSPANWLRVHPINAPFPDLLQREEVSVIFGDSWIAKQIKKGAKHGINFLNNGGYLVEGV